MVGLIALVVIGLYIVVAYFCIRKAKGRKGKAIVASIFILLPAADVIAGRIYFTYLCNTQSGQFIYKTVELEDDYFLKKGEIDKSRFGDHQSGYTVAKGGEINKIKLSELYDFKDVYKVYSKTFHIFKREKIIKNKKSNEILSKFISFRYRGGWVENIYNMSSGIACPSNKSSMHAQLIKNSFKEKN